MSRAKHKKQIETLAWITDDEAEFWTNITPLPEDKPNRVDSNSRNPNNSSSNSEVPDNRYFKFDKPLDKETNQTDEDKKKTENIYDSKEIIYSNPNESPKVDMNFVNRLVHQILRPSSSDKAETSVDQEQPDKIDSNGIKEEKDEKNRINSINDNIVLVKGRGFIDELNEEIDVIRGNLDEETFRNRRSRQAKASVSSVSSVDDNKQLLTQTSF